MQIVRTQILKRAEILIWHEATMSSKHVLNAVNMCLQDIMGNNKPFGGKLVVFGGDFRQTLSVVEHGSKQQEINMCIQSSKLWKGITVKKLIQNMRIKTLLTNNMATKQRLQKWNDYLLSVGSGQENKRVADNINRKFIKQDIPPELTATYAQLHSLDIEEALG